MNMELRDGMMAVVRGMQDAALCVTLMDGTRQYTLMPNAAVPQSVPPVTYVQATQKTEIVQHDSQERSHCDSTAQATDGRYASMYKMAHCNVAPTSPPVAVTEFPPQKAELCPGHGNFEVGGHGSGENYYSPTRACGSYRGGMSWPDRGAVCTPRPSHSPDAFASSLRKYPNISPERSSEVMERLVNYTQLKNSASYSSRLAITSPHQFTPTNFPARNLRNTSPSRSESSTQNHDRLSRCSRRFEDIRSPDESPTRDRRRTEEVEYRRVYGRSYDVRYMREISRRVRDSVKNFSTYPYNHPVCPTIKERYDHLPPEQRNIAELLTASNSVNMETQAEIPMVSREVTTMPREQPSVRNVAIPLSPSSSLSEAKPDKSVRTHSSSKSIQTTKALDLTLNIRKSVQTCFSSSDIQDNKKVKSKRKSKSQEELRIDDDFEEEIVQLIQDLTSCPNLDRENLLRNKCLRKLRKIYRTDRSERVKIKIGRCIKDQLYSEIDLKSFTRELSNELISKIKRHKIFIGNSSTNVYHADLHQYRTSHEENCVDEIIREWMSDIPIKSIDYLGRDVKKGHLLHSIANKVRSLIINKLKYNSDSTMKSDIIELMEDIPIDISGHNKRFFLNRLVSELLRKIKEIFTLSHGRKRWRRPDFPYKYIQPTEKELKLFIREEITEFTSKFHLKLCPDILKQIEIELIPILMDSIEMIKLGNVEDVKEDMLGMLAEFVNISEHQAIYFANNLIYNLKDIFDRSNCVKKPRSQTFIVLQNTTTQETSKNTEYSLEEISQNDIDANIEFYVKQIVQQINEWSANIKGFEGIDSNFRKVVINDLAGDIVDRHKYLELNPSSKKTEADEIEHLKYQIFKWINKVVGEYNLDTIDRAAELMKKIRSVPVPMLRKPQNNKSAQPQYCQNANATLPNIQAEALQSTSNGRRFSSPEQFQPQIFETQDQGTHSSVKVLTGKEFMEQNKRQSITIPEKSCCENAFTSSGANATTESRFNASVGVTSTPKRSAPTEALAQTRMRQPQAPSVSMREQLREGTIDTDRRMSLPAGFPSGAMRINQRPEASKSGLGSPCKINKINCCADTSSKTASLEPSSIKQLNDEYDEFVKDWVQQIPIATSSPEEQALAEKAKVGIYNGIWKSITKLKMNPATMNNPFYYQDVFDDELEELLSHLPQTPDLVNKKHMMKSQLIEKTTTTNEQIVNAAGPSSYKQQLVENVTNNLPRNVIDYPVKDIARLYEEMQKMNLVEDFILYIKYRDDDRIKANVFKRKLMKEIQELVNGIKANYGKELKDIDAAAYIDEVIAALLKVPLPSEDTIREEADEINIGLEIEQWFSDLPILPADDGVERLGRRRYKDALAKKIHDIEKQSPVTDCDDLIKEEVRRFLERMPLRPSEAGNIDFMVDELVNRLKNKSNDFVALGGERKKSVAFADTFEYDDFSRDMPVCSSFSDLGRPQANQSSYMVAAGTRVKNNDPYPQYSRQKDASTEPGQQWFSLEETKAPPGLNTPGLMRQDAVSPCCKSKLTETTALPAQTSNQLPPSRSSFSQTPEPVTAGGPECSNDPRSYTEQSRFDSPRLAEQSPLRFDLEPQQFSQAPQRYDQGSQRFQPQTIQEFPETASQGTETGYDNPKTCEASCKSRRSSAPPSYRTDGMTRPISAQTPDFQPNRFHSPKLTIPSSHFCDPIGYSTPQQNASPPASCRPRKKTRDIENTRKEAARRRLVLEDTDADSEEEVRCRCMEKVWRCRRKKPCPVYDDTEYVPYYMGFPQRPCFF